MPAIVPRLLALGLLCAATAALPAALAFAQGGKPAPAAPAKPAAVPTEPGSTTASFGDWVLRCQRGGGDKPASCGIKVCYDTDQDTATRTVLERWPNMFLPGELAAVLPEPRHFEQASTLVTEEHVRNGPMPLGDDPEEHVRSLTACHDAGFDHVYVNQIGPDMEGFFDLYRTKILPQLPR